MNKINNRRREFLKTVGGVGLASLVIPGIIGCGEEGDINPTIDSNKNINIIPSKKKISLDLIEKVSDWDRDLRDSIITEKTLETLLKGTTERENGWKGILKIWEDTSIRYSVDGNDDFKYLVRKAAKIMNKDTPVNMIESNSNINLTYKQWGSDEFTEKYNKHTEAKYYIYGSNKTGKINIRMQNAADTWFSIFQENLGVFGLVKDLKDFKNVTFSQFAPHTILNDKHSKFIDSNNPLYDTDKLLFKILGNKIEYNKTTADDLIRDGVVKKEFEKFEKKYNFTENFTDSGVGFKVKIDFDKAGKYYGLPRKTLLNLNDLLLNTYENYENLSLKNFHRMDEEDKKATLVKTYCSFPKKINYLS